MDANKNQKQNLEDKKEERFIEKEEYIDEDKELNQIYKEGEDNLKKILKTLSNFPSKI
jgi:predicted nuclease with TOPRIM domain